MKIKIANNHRATEGTDLNQFLPSDKSISQRALLIASLQTNSVKISNLNCSNSILPLIEALRTLGVRIKLFEKEVEVGCFYNCSKEDKEEKKLFLGSSSAAARFLMGVLVGLERKAIIDGDGSLRARPMHWLVDPLRELGAQIEYLEKDGFLPVRLIPSKLKSGSVVMTVGSAQAVSGVLYAAYAAKINVDIKRTVISRDHTERLLSFIGNTITSDQDKTLSFRFNNSSVLYEHHVIPNDPSGLAYLIAAYILLNKKGELRLNNVCLNPTRTGFIELLKRSGADIEFINVREHLNESIGDIIIKPSQLKNPMLLNDDFLFHAMIDEIPLAVALATFIDGVSEFYNLGELIFKETDRIKTTIEMLGAYGACIDCNGDSIKVVGKQSFNAGTIPSFYDHRIAMSAVIVGSTLTNHSEILEAECINTSFPEFLSAMQAMGFDICSI